MPAILSMAYWLRNPYKSALSQRTVLDTPYPGGSWYTEKKNNEYLLFLCYKALEYSSLARKHMKDNNFSDNDKELLRKLAEYRVNIREPKANGQNT